MKPEILKQTSTSETLIYYQGWNGDSKSTFSLFSKQFLTITTQRLHWRAVNRDYIVREERQDTSIVTYNDINLFRKLTIRGRKTFCKQIGCYLPSLNLIFTF